MAKSNYKVSGLATSHTEINNFYKLVVTYRNNDGKRIRTFVGVEKLVNLIGANFVDRFYTQMRSGNYTGAKYNQNHTFKLRRGIAVSFYAY